MSKFRYLLATLPLLLPAAARADEPVDTVRVLMDMAIHNSTDPGEGKLVQEEYFSANMLLRFFSEDFTRAFATALLKTNERREELMIDWDPIIGGQDSCPLKDVTYGQAKEKGKKIEGTVSYKARTCFGDDSGNNDVGKVTFTLVKEEVAGTTLYLIDDIGHRNEASLKTTLGEIAK